MNLKLCRVLPLTALLWLAAASQASAQEGAFPNLGEPILRLEAGGPTGDISALAFAPDGQRLYAGGWDKVVRVWNRDPKSGDFIPERIGYRVPIGPGLAGAINAIALSSDGKWLAVGGLGVFRGQSGFRLPGLIVPREALTPQMREDEGTIYIFETAKPGHARTLRGHRGPVLNLAFVQSTDNSVPVLLSAARVWSEANQRYTGEVRAWDIDLRTTLAQFADLPDPVGKIPGMAAWRTGPAPDQIQAALAWEDNDFKVGGKLRIWDASRKRVVVNAEPEGNFNITAAFLAPNRLVTGSLQADGNGRLQTWHVPASDKVTAGARIATSQYDPVKKTTLIPRALGLVASGRDGKFDHVAVAMRFAPSSEYRLQLVGLAGAKGLSIQDSVPLWDKGTRVPVLATAARGSAIAVAGGPDHSIRVYSVADLLQKKNRPQVLQSIGARVGQAAFVARGQGKDRHLGLILAETSKTAAGDLPRQPQAGDVLLDFELGKLSSAVAGWKLDMPAPAGWTPTFVPPNAQARVGPQIAIKSPTGETSMVKIDADRIVTDYALLPPRMPLNVPLLAVASAKGNEPELSIYHGRTGDQLCQLTGHLGPIGSVAFSADGRLLVSTGTDQTVCIWTLVDLDPFVGKQGQLRGVIVQQAKEGGLVVTSVSPNSPAKGMLKKDDRIRGLATGDKIREFASAPDFYDAFLMQVPGKDATLQLVGGRKVTVPISQAAQERTPLLVLFMTRGERAEAREWLAWNPLGPYDSSSPKMARVIGWHFNTGKAEEPVQFIPPDEGRSKERREGLLKHLIARGSLIQGLKGWKGEQDAKLPPPPLMGFGVDEMEGRELHKPSAPVRLHVERFPLERIHDAVWSIDGGPWLPFRDKHVGEQENDYSQPIEWKRGAHKLRALLRTGGDAPRSFFAPELKVTYAPPSPVVELLGPAAEAASGKTFVTHDPKFSFAATVKPGIRDETVAVRIYHQNVEVNSSTPKGSFVRQEINLQPGVNRIELTAVNGGTLSDTKLMETYRVRVDVVFSPPSPPAIVPPPLIALEGIVPVHGNKEPSAMLPIQREKAIVVTVPNIRLVGAIRAVKNLTAAQLEAKPDAPVDLANFRPHAEDKFAIDERLALRPGTQTLTVRASADQSKEAVQDLRVEYRPALPRAEFAAPPEKTYYYDDGTGPPEVRVGGPIHLPRDPGPVSVKMVAALLVNGQAVDSPIGVEAGNWTAAFRLKPGVNRVQVKLRNDWQEAIFGGDLSFTYLRLPYDVRAAMPAQVDRPVFKLVAQVESSLPLARQKVHCTVGDQDVGDLDVTPPLNNGTTWQIRASVPLVPGSNEIQLDVENADGAIRMPGRWVVNYVPPVPPPAPPVVAWLEPTAQAGLSEYSLMTTRPKLLVKFRVSSPAPLKRVALTESVNGVSNAREFDLAEVAKAGTSFELSGQTTLELKPGLTLVRVQAEHAAATGMAPALLVNFVPPPVQLVFESLHAPEGGERVSPVVEKPDGTLTCAAVAKGRISLQGHVRWNQTEAALTSKQPVNVYVNGALQWTGALAQAKAGKLERSFTAEIVLSQHKANEIEVELPSLKLPEHQVRRFTVDCESPVPGRWLHVQIISPGDGNVRKLVGLVLDTMQASDYSPSKETFKRIGFDEARMYRPLVDDELDEDNVVFQLTRIKRRIEARARDGWPNDVVLIYFVGGELVDNEGQFMSLVNNDSQRALITRPCLERAFADTLGIKVLLLDVTRKSAEIEAASERSRRDVAMWLESPTRHAWMRAAWLDKEKEPAEVRLLAVLKKTLPASDRLGDVASGMEQQFQQLALKYGAIRSDSYLPPPLRDLHLKDNR